jgi:hypothetical protein
MTQKIAVAVIHGVGHQSPNYSERFADNLKALCELVCGQDIVVEPVYWSPVFKSQEETLWEREQTGGALCYTDLRQFMISYLGDAIAYQITETDRQGYDQVHQRFADALGRLVQAAGPKAPLCVVAHSLGSVIASNYLYDLQVDPQRQIISSAVRDHIGPTPLERGETLTLFYTLGSPLALWSLRFQQFGKPIEVPAPGLAGHFAGLRGEWINFYSKTDVIASPLKTLNADYARVVCADKPVEVGGLLTSWNPASHLDYWSGQSVLESIAQGLIRVWKTVNV